MSNENIKRAGRPNKQGLAYFAHLVNRSDEENILINTFGCLGYAVYYYILEKITGNGYYYELNKKRILLICSTLHIEQNEFEKILNYCFELDLFNQELYNEYSILTSEKVQENYLYASLISRRKQINFYQEYYLISDVYYYESVSTEARNKIYTRSIYDNNNSINDNNNVINSTENKHNKSNSNNENNTINNSNSKQKDKNNIALQNGKGSKRIVKELEGKTQPDNFDTGSDDEYRALFNK